MKVVEATELFFWRARENRHGCFVGGRNSMAIEDAPDGEEQNLEVEPDALVIHIPNIIGELFFPRNRVAAVDLRPACQPGREIVAARLFLVIERKILDEQ